MRSALASQALRLAKLRQLTNGLDVQMAEEFVSTAIKTLTTANTRITKDIAALRAEEARQGRLLP